jgi:hypothetical protein
VSESLTIPFYERKSSNQSSIEPQGGTLLDAGVGPYAKRWDHRLDGARSAPRRLPKSKHDIMGSHEKAMLE